MACITTVPAHADLVSVLAPAQAVQGCGDFLAQMGKKPAHVIYLGCSSMPDRQGKPLQAVYHVAGRFAAAAEADLVRHTGLNRLKRSCCQWDAPASQFRDGNGREFSITMVSDETVVARRSEWRQIGTFEIIVETFTEDI
ncbi:DUF4952 domain-containing protein [Mesorhizobium loti]|uniref:DUF4952 domain-containing protein n=1 Tax=Rhizobium loti TaxID=381 RepID=UPI00053ABBCF|nr:DUF4952 domain-containing protein [Mesorhizobium loti]